MHVSIITETSQRKTDATPSTLIVISSKYKRICQTSNFQKIHLEKQNQKQIFTYVRVVW